MIRPILLIFLCAVLLTTTLHAKATRHQNPTETLPYSCSTIRWAVATFDRDWLEQQARLRGITLTQQRAIRQCLSEAKHD